MLKIHTRRALKDNFIYFLENAPGQCAVVDPGEPEPVYDFLAQNPKLKLTHVLCTHHHADHVGAVLPLTSRWPCEVVGSAFDQNRIAGLTQNVSEGPFQLWDTPITILATPGHTMGQIAYFLPQEEALFVGDTLFSAGCGRLFEGTAEQMFMSLQKIKKLPLQTKIYFGHEYTLRNLEFVLQQEDRLETREYFASCQRQLAAGQPTTPTTVQQELQINPFLRAQNVEEFRAWREARNNW